MNKISKIILWTIPVLIMIGLVYFVNLFFGIEPPFVLGPGWSIHKYVHSYNVYKGDLLVATIKPESGYLTSAASPPSSGQERQKHPFITASTFVPEEENNLHNLLERAKNFNEYVSLLNESGYRISLAHP